LNGLILPLAETEAQAPPEWWVPIFWIGVVFAVFMVLGRLAVAGETKGVPRSVFTNIAEQGYLFIENMCLSVIGQHGRRYIPLVFTIWIVVFLSNLFGVLGLFAPTSTLGITLGSALLVVFYVQWEGIKSNGPFGYVGHFFGPKLPPLMIPITLLLFVIELVSEVAKNVSLSFRLYGNISGEHRVGETLGNLVHIGNFGVPLQALLMPLSIFVAVVQALVFTILTCVYLSLMTAHEAEHAHTEHKELGEQHTP